jgi:hypothetical protein
VRPTDGAPAYASAAHAARLIGRSDRIVQLWMREAGHEDAWVPNAGYPVALLCEVVNRHKWKHQFVLTPEHFNSDQEPSAIADETAPETGAALALLSDLHRALLDNAERQTAMAAELAELRAQVAQLLADGAAQRERDEKAAQRGQDGRERVEAALDRIEQGQRRKGLWARILGR